MTLIRAVAALALYAVLLGAWPVAAQETAPAAETQSQPTEPRFESFVIKRQIIDGELAEGMTARDLIDVPLINGNEEEIAVVTDFLIGPDNRIDKLIVDVGGFLGLGERQVAVDIADLDVIRSPGGATQLQTLMTKEELERLPRFEFRDNAWFLRK